MSNEMKAKLKPIIVIVIIIVILVAGFFIAKSVLGGSKSIPILDFGDDDTNSSFEEDIITTDDIFGDDITPEEKDFLATNNTIITDKKTNDINTNNIKVNDSLNLSNSGLYEVNTNNIPDVPKSSTSKPSTIEDTAYTYNTSNSVIVTDSDTLKPKNNYNNIAINNNNNINNNNINNNESTNQELRISSFIINYNDRFVATRKNPLLITLAIKTPPEAKYAKIRVYARRVDNNYKILSRDLVFYLPKIYVLEGQVQTQFYFAGRISGKEGYLPKGRYLLYAETEITDANGKSVGKVGRYPLPKWNYVITLK